MFKYIILFASTHIPSASGKSSWSFWLFWLQMCTRGPFPKWKDLSLCVPAFIGIYRESCSYVSQGELERAFFADMPWESVECVWVYVCVRQRGADREIEKHNLYPISCSCYSLSGCGFKWSQHFLYKEKLESGSRKNKNQKGKFFFFFPFQLYLISAWDYHCSQQGHSHPSAFSLSCG